MLLAQHLHGDVATQVDVAGLEDHANAAPRDLALELIAGAVRLHGPVGDRNGAHHRVRARGLLTEEDLDGGGVALEEPREHAAPLGRRDLAERLAKPCAEAVLPFFAFRLVAHGLPLGAVRSLGHCRHSRLTAQAVFAA